MTSLTIQGQLFEVPDAAIANIIVGYQLQEEGEVHALRQTKLENLRNNFAPKVKSALDGAESISPDTLTALQAEFAKYALEYKFGVRTAGAPRTRMDEITKEMYNLAKADFREAYFAVIGEKPEKDLVEERAEELMEKRHDDLHRRATAILRQKHAGGDKKATLEALGM
jgi:hypothetical protein